MTTVAAVELPGSVELHIGQKDYVGTFANEHGEPWVFVQHHGGEGYVIGSETDWKPVSVTEGKPENFLLSECEQSWLTAVWAASEWVREGR